MQASPVFSYERLELGLCGVRQRPVRLLSEEIREAPPH